MPKRKSGPAEAAAVEPLRRRSGRLQKSEDAAPAKPDVIGSEQLKPASKKSALKRRSEKSQEQPAAQPEPPAKKGRLSKKPATTKGTVAAGNTATSKADKPEVATSKVAETAPNGSTNTDGERNYWLLKAEPESRLENGVDVRFSIDDLAARTEPEPWDGKL